MAKQIAARRKGDAYQARVFWLKLLEMRTGDYIESVTFENDQVSFVDDVVVSYRQPRKEQATGKRVRWDFFQCKYHMTQGGAFTAENLINPVFINNSKNSMLKRLHEAYVRLSEELGPGEFRLYIFSNWQWDSRDRLAKHLHEEMLRPTFYEQGPKSKEGQVRSTFAKHLSISEEDLCAFLHTVRFTLGKNLVDLEREMEPRLQLAGMKPIDSTVTHSVYDELAWKLFEQGRNSFNEETFNQMVQEEKLMAPPPTEHSEISIQSFSQFARRPHDLQSAHLDLRPCFHERFPKTDASWQKEIPERVAAFMLDEKLMEVPQPIHLFFDCHLSIAFFAGHLISPKHRIQVIPTQKSGSTYEPWEPNGSEPAPNLWTCQSVREIDTEVLLGISVTHDIQEHLHTTLVEEGLSDVPRILVCPTGGVGRTAVSGGAHAWHLGVQLEKWLRERLPQTCQTIHLFFAGPVALGYILGHTLQYITPCIQLYEHDFEGVRGGQRYYPSLRLPYHPEP